MTPLPRDFREFLQLLNSEKVEYLLIGGYAVGHHGHPRVTGDMDIWVAATPENAARVVRVLKAFGFDDADRVAALLAREKQVIRMGNTPVRIEVLTSISGATFAECYAKRTFAKLDDTLEISVIGLAELKANKKASGRRKDLDDLEHLPG